MRHFEKEYGQPIEILKYNDFKGRPCMVSDSGIEKDASGNKIVKAGTPLNSSGTKETFIYTKTKDTTIDETKKYYTLSGGVYTEVAEPKVADIATYYEVTGVDVAGILLHDTDVTYGEEPGTVLFEGSIDNKKLTKNGVTVSDAVKKALPRVTFFD